jgi:hypothetical protein
MSSFGQAWWRATWPSLLTTNPRDWDKELRVERSGLRDHLLCTDRHSQIRSHAISGACQRHFMVYLVKIKLKNVQCHARALGHGFCLDALPLGHTFRQLPGQWCCVLTRLFYQDDVSGAPSCNVMEVCNTICNSTEHRGESQCGIPCVIVVVCCCVVLLRDTPFGWKGQ